MAYKYPFGVVWLSHSSMSDFEKCPRLYYLRNIYKEKPAGKKIQVVSPYLTLGIAVHDTLERIRYIPRADRFLIPLTDIFEEIWAENSGKKGGFSSEDEEKEFKERGYMMVKRVMDNPGPIGNLSTRIKLEGEMVSSMWLSEKDNLVLCGNVDWVEVLPDGSIHIIDFKTGKHEENTNSLQLQIYLLLAKNGNKRPVTRLSYWYLEKEDSPKEIPIPDLDGVMEILVDEGNKMKQARLSERGAGMRCLRDGCRYCEDYEKVLNKEAVQVGYDSKREKILYAVE